MHTTFFIPLVFHQISWPVCTGLHWQVQQLCGERGVVINMHIILIFECVQDYGPCMAVIAMEVLLSFNMEVLLSFNNKKWLTYNCDAVWESSSITRYFLPAFFYEWSYVRDSFVHNPLSLSLYAGPPIPKCWCCMLPLITSKNVLALLLEWCHGSAFIALFNRKWNTYFIIPAIIGLDNMLNS